MKFLSSKEVFFLFIVSCCLLGSSVMLVNDMYFSSNSRTGEKVGTITYKNKFAEQKPVGSSLWASLPQDGPVYNRDTIRTGPESTAVIHLDNKTEITLNEESMVFIDIVRKAATLKLAGGSLLIDNASDQNEVTLQTKSGDLSLQGGKLQVRQDQGGLKLKVQGGSSRISKNGDKNPVTLVQNANYDFTTGNASMADILLETPKNGDILVSSDSSQTVTFTWQIPGNDKDNPAKDRTLLIAKDLAFSNIERRIDKASSGNSINLPEGIHYWKLSGSEEVSWFTLKKGQVPKPVSPIEVTFSKLNKPLNVQFSWTKTTDTDRYRLELYKKENLQTPILSKVIDQKNTTAGIAETGEYVWKVIGLVGPTQVEFPSSLQSFVVVDGQLETPQINALGQTSDSALRISSLSATAGKTIAGWRPVPNAEAYTVRLAKEQDAKSPYQSLSVKSTYFSLTENLPVGTWFLTIQATAGKNTSSFSQPVKLEVFPVTPLKTLEPKDSETLIKSDNKIRFSWQDDNRGERYRLLVSASPDLSAPLIAQDTETTAFSAAFKEKGLGAFYWQVMLLDTDSKILTKTPINTFTLSAPVIAPIPISPVRGESLDVNTLDTITLSWKPDEYQRTYHIRLFRMTGGIKSLVDEWSTQDTSIVIKDFSKFAIDNFAWELVARENREDGSIAESLPVLSYFKVIQKKRLSIPKIKRMTSRGEY